MSTTSVQGYRSCSDFGAIDDLPAYNHMQPSVRVDTSDKGLQEARRSAWNSFSFKINTQIELDGQQHTLFCSLFLPALLTKFLPHLLIQRITLAHSISNIWQVAVKLVNIE